MRPPVRSESYLTAVRSSDLMNAALNVQNCRPRPQPRGAYLLRLVCFPLALGYAQFSHHPAGCRATYHNSTMLTTSRLGSCPLLLWTSFLSSVLSYKPSQSFGHGFLSFFLKLFGAAPHLRTGPGSRTLRGVLRVIGSRAGFSSYSISRLNFSLLVPNFSSFSSSFTFSRVTLLLPLAPLSLLFHQILQIMRRFRLLTRSNASGRPCRLSPRCCKPTTHNRRVPYLSCCTQNGAKKDRLAPKPLVLDHPCDPRRRGPVWLLPSPVLSAHVLAEPGCQPRAQLTVTKSRSALT